MEWKFPLEKLNIAHHKFSIYGTIRSEFLMNDNMCMLDGNSCVPKTEMIFNLWRRMQPGIETRPSKENFYSGEILSKCTLSILSYGWSCPE